MAAIAQIVYPSGTAQPSLTGPSVIIYRGWPIPRNLDGDLAAGKINISVFAQDNERNVTRFPREWQPLAQPTNSLTATVSGQTVILGGTVATPLNVAVSSGGKTYLYAVQPSDTLASIATALATLINQETPATSSGSVVAIPAAFNLTAIVGGAGSMIREIKRQKRGFMVTLWCPDPDSRDDLASPLDAALAAIDYLSLPDGSAARVIYEKTVSLDKSEGKNLYRRDLFYSVEYPTTQAQVAYQIIATPLNLRDFDGNPIPSDIVPLPPTRPVEQFLLGLNAASLETGGAIPGIAHVNYGIPTTAELDYYKSRGLTFFRLPFLWERMQPTLLGDLDPDYLGYVQALVGYAGANGMSLLLDCHNFGGYSIDNGDGTRTPHLLGGGTLTNDHFADFWTRMATVFAGLPGVAGYDLMNEPHDMPSNYAWPDAAQAAITAIRAVDTTTTIYVEGDGYSSAFAFAQNNPTLHALVDPADNLIFSAHTYLDRNSSGIYFDWTTEVAAGDQLTTPTSPLDVNIGVKRISAFAAWLTRHGLRGHIGECGVPNNDPNWLIALDNTIACVRQNNLQMTYWNAGPFYAGYPLGVEPKNGQDTVQMAVLTKYTGGAQPSAYYASGPNRGASGLASAPFTVTYRGYITAPITVTPNDNGAGGTFTPASVTLANGFNGVATFRYTPPGLATYTVSFTNNAGLTDPAPLGISTRSDPFAAAASAPTNVFSLRRVFTPYIGPAVTLRRDSDNATRSFYFLPNDDLDVASITTWAGSANLFLATWYDQSPNGYNAGPAGTSPTIGDQPRFFASGGANNKPYLAWTSNRMDATSPINGNSAQTILALMKPASASSGFLAAWTEVQNYQFPSSGSWKLQGETALTMGLDATQWHSYGGRYRMGVAGGVQTFKDGAVVGQESSVVNPPLVLQYDSVVNLGYFRYSPIYFSGQVEEILIFSGALSDADLEAFQASQQSYWTTPNPPGPVTNLTLGTTTPTTQALTWTAAPGAFSYTVQYRPHNSPLWLTALTGVTGTNCTITGLFAKQVQDIQVIGVNSAGNGTAAMATITTPPASAGSAAKIPYIGLNSSGPENAAGALWPSTSQIDYYAGKGINVIRLPTAWESWQATLNATLNPTYLAGIDAQVSYAASKGIKTIIDIHSYGSYGFRSQRTTTTAAIASGATSFPVASAANLPLGTRVNCSGVTSGTTIVAISGNTITLSAPTTAAIASGTAVGFAGYIGVADTGGNISVTNAHFANLWSQIATHYLGNQNVIFGLMNEPAQTSIPGWLASCQAAATAIRATGADQLILVPNNPGGGFNIAFAAAVKSSFTDPNFALEIHRYFDSTGAGIVGTVISPTIAAEDITQPMTWARQAGIKLWYGEFGAGAGDTAVQALNNMMAAVSENPDLWAGLTIWGGGAEFNSSLAPGGYALGINPYNGADTPQLLATLSLAPGGALYGNKRVANAYPLSLIGASFGPASSGWGQALTGGYGIANNGAFPQPNTKLIASTIECRVTLPASTTLTGNVFAMGVNSNGIGCLGVNSAGKVIGGPNGNLVSTVSVKDGNPHHLRYCADGTTGYLFVDGILVASAPNPLPSLASPDGGFPTYVGCYKAAASSIWPGTVEYAAMYGVSMGGTNFTPPSAPLSPGTPYLVALWQLDGDGTGTF